MLYLYGTFSGEPTTSRCEVFNSWDKYPSNLFFPSRREELPASSLSLQPFTWLPRSLTPSSHIQQPCRHTLIIFQLVCGSHGKNLITHHVKQPVGHFHQPSHLRRRGDGIIITTSLPWRRPMPRHRTRHQFHLSKCDNTPT